MSELWRKLSEKEEVDFRESARKSVNLEEHDLYLNNLWHPVFRLEVAKMIIERAEKELSEIY